MEWAIEIALATGKTVAASMCIGPDGDENGVPVGECAVRYSFYQKEPVFFMVYCAALCTYPKRKNCTGIIVDLCNNMCYVLSIIILQCLFIRSICTESTVREILETHLSF